jgi:hypothetical protein
LSEKHNKKENKLISFLKSHKKERKEVMQHLTQPTDSWFKRIEVQAVKACASVCCLVIDNKTFILLNWPDDCGGFSQAVEWGKSNDLQKTAKDDLLAIEAKHPELNHELGLSSMSLVETTGHLLQKEQVAYNMWWHGEGHAINVRNQDCFSYKGAWFTFIAKVPIS